MITVISPSKSMDMASVKQVDCTEPKFLEKSKELVSSVRKLGTTGLMDFMDVSEKLAELNVQRFKEWKPPFSIANAKQALFAFTGDVYDGLDATTLQPRDIQFAQNHLRILSGLYGLLKPLDLIQPYRLEMGRPLKTNRARTLYEFWRGTITEELNRTKGDLLVNLASQEYFKAIDTRKLDKKIITPEFKDEKNGQFKTISFFAKKARGTMARFIIQHRIDSEEGIRAFTESGYAHNAELSKPGAPVFTRTQP
ncbi:MAG: peroxide stress protein YaaA [Kiritimatiellales bacterium]|nr:peroxide stress protein YaaA [Kiritimatiellales bacterium]